MTQATTIAFLCGSLFQLLIHLCIWWYKSEQTADQMTAAIENARRRAYARGYEEGNLHGRGQFISRHSA